MIIPYLREDLEILRGNSREDGSPAWLLYDALRNKYFTLGLTAFKLIKNWSGGEDIKVFEKKINRDGIEADSDEIKKFIDFLQLNNLIIQPRGQFDNILLKQKNAQKKNWLLFLIHSYLFLNNKLMQKSLTRLNIFLQFLYRIQLCYQNYIFRPKNIILIA